MAARNSSLAISGAMKNGQVKKLKEPVRLSARCVPASKTFRCCSNSSRFSISFMIARLSTRSTHKQLSAGSIHCQASLFGASGVRVVRRVRRHVEMPSVEVIRRAHLADGVIERIVGRHRSERGMRVRMIRTLRAEISMREVELGQRFTRVLAAVVGRLSVAMILRLENACKA